MTEKGVRYLSSPNPNKSYSWLWLVGLGLALALSFASFNFAPLGVYILVLVAFSLGRLAVQTVKAYRRGRPRLGEWLATIWAGLGLIAVLHFVFDPGPAALGVFGVGFFTWTTIMNAQAWARAETLEFRRPAARLALMALYCLGPAAVVALAVSAAYLAVCLSTWSLLTGRVNASLEFTLNANYLALAGVIFLASLTLVILLYRVEQGANRAGRPAGRI